MFDLFFAGDGLVDVGGALMPNQMDDAVARGKGRASFALMFTNTTCKTIPHAAISVPFL